MGTHSVSVRLDDKMYAEVRRLAGEHDRSLNGEVNAALRAWLILYGPEHLGKKMGLPEPLTRAEVERRMFP